MDAFERLVNETLTAMLESAPSVTTADLAAQVGAAAAGRPEEEQRRLWVCAWLAGVTEVVERRCDPRLDGTAPDIDLDYGADGLTYVERARPGRTI